MFPKIALLHVGIISCVGVALSFIDKYASRIPNARRVPEFWFYLTAFFGGTPGVLLGMHFFRHKTKKVSFQMVIILIVILQIGFLFLILGDAPSI